MVDIDEDEGGLTGLFILIILIWFISLCVLIFIIVVTLHHENIVYGVYLIIVWVLTFCIAIFTMYTFKLENFGLTVVLGAVIYVMLCFQMLSLTYVCDEVDIDLKAGDVVNKHWRAEVEKPGSMDDFQSERNLIRNKLLTVASNEGTNNATGSGSGEPAALFSKLRSFSIGSGPNSPQRVVSNLRGFLTHRLSNITPSDTEPHFCDIYYDK
ncbi:uncharacterized protein LOC119676597 [Teleopsis dalmanni]|uniref:uncharacterized protein LOC119676597 n=1 Tax=Teleopsis dalmanni TaxID=139649 RepID=UPI0018CC7F3D|nr:uncharacterized protein LOC119676597 [Teleopsis dalmanni]